MIDSVFRGGIGCKDTEKGQLLDNQILVAREIRYPMRPRSSYEYGRMTVSQFHAYCSMNKHAYECLVDTRNLCLFFDIDSEMDLNFFMGLLRNKGINECILLDSSDFQFNISTDLNKLIYSFLDKPLKFSYHIICPNQVFNHIHTMKQWVIQWIVPNLQRFTIDLPYTRDRIIRVQNQTKLNSFRVLRNKGWYSTDFLKLRPANFFETLITTRRNVNIFFSPTLLAEPKKVVSYEERKQTLVNGNYLSIPVTTNRNLWLALVSSFKTIGYSAHQIFAWDPSETHHKGLSEFLSQFKRLKPRADAKDLLDSFFVSKQFKEAFGLKYCTRRINQRYVSDLKLEKRVTLIKSECGTGKSVLTKRFIRAYLPLRILVLISSRALCYDTKKESSKSFASTRGFNRLN